MENAKHIKVLTLRFNTTIAAWEIPLFRGAVLNAIGSDVDILFHNHTADDGYRYSYPLIQYKRLGGKAAIVCVEEGVDSIGQFLMAQQPEIVLGERSAKLEMESVRPQNVLRLAHEIKRPAFWIMSDKTLHELTRQAPTTIEALSNVKGLGAQKTEQYADLFTTTIACTWKRKV